MIHLRTLDIQPIASDTGFPFSLPVVLAWESLEFTSPVTFFVGENGSGKSTVLEALAAAASMITAGAAPVGSDPALKDVRRLSRAMSLSWHKRTRKGFFLRAEDFVGFVKGQEQMRTELEADLKRVDEEYADRSDYAKGLAKMASAGQLREMEARYRDGLEHRSHGEQFIDFFQGRFVPDGLYLLDEPEAPLSPLRQLGFLALVKESLAQNAQFIIATHSPILMAFPDAQILSFDSQPPAPVPYEDLEHVRVTREFLNNPQAYLRHL